MMDWGVGAAASLAAAKEDPPADEVCTDGSCGPVDSAKFITSSDLSEREGSTQESKRVRHNTEIWEENVSLARIFEEPD